MFDDGDDEDESLIRSILERRNFSFAPTRRESRDRGFGRDRSNRNASKGRKHDGTTSSGNHDNRHQKRRRRKTPKNPNSLTFQQRLHIFRPLLFLAMAGILSNWTASRILTRMFLGDENMYRYQQVRMNADALDGKQGNPTPQRQDAPLDMITSDQILHQRLDDRGRPPEPAADRMVTTKRFLSFRRKLSNVIYTDEETGEEGGTPDGAISPRGTVHPLYNETSPQYMALDWLANVDKFRVRLYSENLVQRYVLAVLYYSTGGPRVTAKTDFSAMAPGRPWRDPTNFLSPVHECKWRSNSIETARGRGGGVRRCDKNQTVVEISLYNELEGTLPSELGKLWNLRVLYLGRNHLHGTIPTELGSIEKLASLSLQQNELSGTIPQDSLKNLGRLRALQLEGNEKIVGLIDKHSLLCQMTPKYKNQVLPPGREAYTGEKRILRKFTASCLPVSGIPPRGILECACCTECFGKRLKDQIY